MTETKPASRTGSTVLKVFLLGLAGCGIFTVSAGVVGAVAVVQQGMISVRVNEHHAGGDHVNIMLPAALVNLGFWCASPFVPADAFGDATDEIARVRPILDAVAAEIDRCPDGPLVEVLDGDEHVTISLEGGAFRVRVESPRESVDVVLPGSVLRATLAFLPDAV